MQCMHARASGQEATHMHVNCGWHDLHFAVVNVCGYKLQETIAIYLVTTSLIDVARPPPFYTRIFRVKNWPHRHTRIALH